MQGWEFEAQTALTGGLGVERSLTLMEAHDETANEDLVRRPRLTVTIGLPWRAGERLRGAVRARHVGARSDIDFSQPPYPVIELTPVTLLEGEVTWVLAEGVAVRLRLRNITDADPEWVWGYGAMGRAFFLGLRLN